ncbi:hypothetical protein AAH994_14625 [Weeksellaceae bacterium A-14]
MMKCFSFVYVLSLLLMSFQTNVLEEARNGYSKAVSDKKLCKEMMQKLDHSSITSVLNFAYLGAFESIWAHHSINPVTKLSTFKAGKNKIEKAIKKEPRNAEIRYIRLSIQKKSPSFLGYKSNINEDMDFLKKNRSQITSKTVLNNIDLLLKE